MEKQTWISLGGKARIGQGMIVHSPDPVLPPDKDAEPTPGQSTIPYVRARSNVEFQQGTITWESRLGDKDNRAQLLLAAESRSTAGADASSTDVSNPELAVGLNVLGAPYGFGIWSGKWEGAGGSGHGTDLPVGEWIRQKLTVRGSVADFYVEGVKVLSGNFSLRRGQISVFISGASESAIRNVSVTEDAPTCFVVMQFTDEFNALYQDVIKPICESYSYRVVRADDIYTSGQIIEDITNSIRSASLIIADITPDNCNVFYEVGFAHAIRKPTILLSDRNRARLPFDISGFRTLFYDNTIGGKNAIEGRLRNHLDALQSEWIR